MHVPVRPVRVGGWDLGHGSAHRDVTIDATPDKYPEYPEFPIHAENLANGPRASPAGVVDVLVSAENQSFGRECDSLDGAARRRCIRRIEKGPEPAGECAIVYASACVGTMRGIYNYPGQKKPVIGEFEVELPSE